MQSHHLLTEGWTWLLPDDTGCQVPAQPSVNREVTEVGCEEAFSQDTVPGDQDRAGPLYSCCV